MDDIESCANPSYNDDYHMYANGLNNFIDVATVAEPGTVNTYNGDHNEWGKIDM